MHELVATPIRGTEGANYPFFSPDGEWVGFFAGNKLKKVPLAGGPPVTLCDAGISQGGSWGPEDTIVFSSQMTAGLMRVSASGGDPEPLTTLDAGEVWHLWPEILPGGRAVLFTTYSGTAGSLRVAVQSLETGERRMLVEGTYPRYVPTGHLVFSRLSPVSLWAVPFDIDRLEVTGEPTPLPEEIRVRGSLGLAQFALAADGSLFYVPGAPLSGSSFVWVDREGNEEPVAAMSQDYQEFALSPEGTRLAVRVAVDDTDDLWIYDLPRDTWTRLTFDPAGERNPLWTPDGQKVAFGGAEGMFWKAADGTGKAEPIMEQPRNQRPEVFSPDGTVLVFQDLSAGRDLGMVSLEGERVSKLLVSSPFQERNAAFSPDGRWMAYGSNESGQFEIYVRPFPDVAGGWWQVSSDGGVWPVWARDGQKLFYVGPKAMMAVTIQTDPTLAPGRPEPLFDVEPYETSSVTRRVALSADGQRFLMLKPAESEHTVASQSIVVVENWLEELKRLVPAH